MLRLAAWWEEFWKSFTWIGVVVEGYEKVMKIVEVLLPLLLLAFGLVISNSEFLNALKPLAPFLIGAAVVYVVWKAAIAWEKTKGPIIWIGSFELDSYYNMFDVRVKNAGHGEVFAKVYVVDLRDSAGKRIPRIDDQWPAHWRGVEGDKCLLFGDKHGTAGILIAGIDPRHTMCPCLSVAMPDVGKPRAALLYPIEPTPVDQQERLTLSIRVDFLDLEEKFIKSKLKTVTIRPPDAETNPLDPKALTKYKIIRR